MGTSGLGSRAGSRAQLGLALLQASLERALAVSPDPTLARWDAWLRSGPRPVGQPPSSTIWQTPRHDDDWVARLPQLYGEILPRIEAQLGREAADRAVSLAREAVSNTAAGDCGLPELVGLLPPRLLDIGEADLLAQIRALEEARSAEATARIQLSAVLDAVAQGILVADARGDIVLANAEAGRIFGHPVEDLTGRPLASLLAERWRATHVQLFDAASSDGRAAQPEKRRLEGVRADGTEFPLEMTLRSTLLPDGTQRATAAIRDLSASLTEQTRLALADRMVSVGTLAAGAAHEINNPLAYLTMNVEFVRGALAQMREGLGLGDIDELVDALDQALDGSRRVQNIVKDLRTFAQADPRKGVGVDLQEAVESALRMVHNEMRDRARVELRMGGQFTVQSDHARLCQVFLNVLHNATQAIAPGAAHEHRVTVTTRRTANGRVEIRIQDTGVGVAPEILDRVFDPFFTTRPAGQGLGLGLSICHTIVSGLGGCISIAPAPERGAVVTIELPATEALTVHRTPPVGSLTPSYSVLVIDDEPMVCRALARALSEHRVTTETMGRRALARLAGGESFDAVLCDAQMPEMSAVQLYNAVSAVRPELRGRFIFMTGGMHTAELRLFLESVHNPCLGKPINLPTLREAIQHLCESA